MTALDTLPPVLVQLLEPLRSVLEDPRCTDILIDGVERAWVERLGEDRVSVPTGFRHAAELSALVRYLAKLDRKAAGEHVSVRLPDGSRVHAIAESCAHRGQGPWITIRRFRRQHLDADALVASGTVPEEVLQRLQSDLCDRRKNLLIAGATGSGKTTLAEVLLRGLDPAERLLLMQDIEEIVPPGPEYAWGSFSPGEGGYEALLSSLMRMMPDRVALGEVRGPEAWVLLDALTTGHSGGVTTLHAHDTGSALRRLETLSLQHPHAPDLRAVRARVADAIDVVVVASRVREGGSLVRRVVEVADVRGVDAHGQVEVEVRWRLEPRAARARASEG